MRNTKLGIERYGGGSATRAHSPMPSGGGGPSEGSGATTGARCGGGDGNLRADCGVFAFDWVAYRTRNR